MNSVPVVACLTALVSMSDGTVMIWCDVVSVRCAGGGGGGGGAAAGEKPFPGAAGAFLWGFRGLSLSLSLLLSVYGACGVSPPPALCMKSLVCR